MRRRTKALLTVLREAQKCAEQLPLKRKADLYRGLAEICADRQEAAHYLDLAREAEALRQRERALQYRLRLEDLE